MKSSKERRRAKRESVFGGHQPEADYRPDQQANVPERTGREWDSERHAKADIRELEHVRPEDTSGNETSADHARKP